MTDWGLLVVVIIWFGKVRLVGLKITGSTPFPVNVAICGVFDALSFTVTSPESAPAAVGVKMTEIVQLDSAASALGDKGQFEVGAKLVEAEMLAIVRGTV